MTMYELVNLKTSAYTLDLEKIAFQKSIRKLNQSRFYF